MKVIEHLQVLKSFITIEQFLLPLDRKNFSAKLRQDYRLVGTARSYFQYPVRGSDIQQLCLISDSIWLRNGLAFTYRKGSVYVSFILQIICHEELPRNGINGCKHIFIRNTFIA